MMTNARNLLALAILLMISGCHATSVNRVPAEMGQQAADFSRMTSAETGSIRFTKHLAARWAVNLSGLVNLDHEAAKQAGLEDRMEPIEIYVYSIEHPRYGTFLIDSGIGEGLRHPGENRDLGFLVKMAMGTESLEVVKTTAQLAEELGGIDGVFLTHLHMDHIMGLADLPKGTPVYIGPGDAEMDDITHLVTRGTTDRLLKQVDALREWQFGESGRLDVFGDGSLIAIHAPGHTPGSTVYLANTTIGRQLMIGDVTHTRWGWEHGVEPGSFSHDMAGAADSLRAIQELATSLGDVAVHPGHQSL